LEQRTILKAEGDEVFGIQQHDLADTDAFVVAEALQLLRQFVVRRQDLDYGPGDGGHDSARGQRDRTQHDIGNAISGAFDDLGPHFRKRQKTEASLMPAEVLN
jgi:hypothetical protein